MVGIRVDCIADQTHRMIARIAITGAPASGKTKCLERLKADRALAGFVFFDELARELLQHDPELRMKPTAFHREIYRRQTAREDALAGRPFVTDRGTVDAFAFHPETLRDVGTTLEQEYDRYTGVILLGSAARLGEAKYKVDNVRTESIADALIIEDALIRVWHNHPTYHFVPATSEWDEKFLYCRSLISQLTGIPNDYPAVKQ
jgi:predicted ATPase